MDAFLLERAQIDLRVHESNSSIEEH